MNRFAPTPGRLEKAPTHHVRAVLASCVFHALLLALVVGWTVYYHAPRLPVTSGSAESVPTLTLSTMVIVSSPLPAPTPVTEKKIPTPPKPPAPVVAIPPPIKATPPVIPPPQEGIPVLTATTKPATAPAPASHASSHPPVAHHEPVKPASAPAPSAVASSFAPGANVFPHPPYPDEARYLRETGTVVVKVRFDARGDVAQVDVQQSSGVSLLDRQTRTYIRQQWHSSPYAGQTLSVPVQYTLEN